MNFFFDLSKKILSLWIHIERCVPLQHGEFRWRQRRRAPASVPPPRRSACRSIPTSGLSPSPKRIDGLVFLRANKTLKFFYHFFLQALLTWARWVIVISSARHFVRVRVVSNTFLTHWLHVYRAFFFSFLFCLPCCKGPGRSPWWFGAGNSSVWSADLWWLSRRCLHAINSVGGREKIYAVLSYAFKQLYGFQMP